VSAGGGTSSCRDGDEATDTADSESGFEDDDKNEEENIEKEI
jgi:hypothetical protein